MTQNIQSANASSAPTKNFEKVFGDAGSASSRARCQVFAFDAYALTAPQPPKKYSSISQLTSEWENDPKQGAALASGRKWVAGSFYADDGDTIRTLRLRKGWSQNALATELGTSQSHVARIERGTENVTIETCRKLARTLKVDLNTLDQMLTRQEAIARAKQK